MNLSVIVIGLNEEANLSRCFLSILSAIRAAGDLIEAHEVIYVDSGSYDNSVMIAGRYADQIFQITALPSAVAARNVGVTESQYDNLLFLDGDMALDQKWLLNSVPLFCTRETHMVGVTGRRNDLFVGKESGEVVRKRMNYYKVRRVKRSYRFGGAIFLKKAAISTVGGFASELRAWEEPDLHARLRQRGLFIVEIPCEFIDHYTPDPSANLATYGRLLARNGSSDLFGRWFWRAYRHKYLRGFFEVNRSVTITLLVDFVSIVGLAMGFRVPALLSQVCAAFIVGRSEGLRFIVLARIWIAGILTSRMFERGEKLLGPDPMPTYIDLTSKMRGQ